MSTDNVIYIRFKNELLFDPDSSGLREESKEVLDRLGSILEDKAGDILAVYINGHTAQAPNSPINDRILSSERADHAVSYTHLDVYKRQLQSPVYVPGELAINVEQYPKVEIEYVGEPLYVPPSANPSYEE